MRGRGLSQAAAAVSAAGRLERPQAAMAAVLLAREQARDGAAQGHGGCAGRR